MANFSAINIVSNITLNRISENSTNKTGYNALLLQQVDWTPTAISNLVIALLGLTENVGLLLLFGVTNSLRTPFTVYLMNLLIANICLVSVQYSVELITDLYHRVPWFMGDGVCSLYLYAVWVLQGTVNGTVFLLYETPLNLIATNTSKQHTGESSHWHL